MTIFYKVSAVPLCPSCSFKADVFFLSSAPFFSFLFPRRQKKPETGKKKEGKKQKKYIHRAVTSVYPSSLSSSFPPPYIQKSVYISRETISRKKHCCPCRPEKGTTLTLLVWGSSVPPPIYYWFPTERKRWEEGE